MNDDENEGVSTVDLSTSRKKRKQSQKKLLKSKNEIPKKFFSSEDLEPEYLIFGRVEELKSDENDPKSPQNRMLIALKKHQYLDKDNLNDAMGNRYTESPLDEIFSKLEKHEIDSKCFRNVDIVKEDWVQTLLSKKLYRLYHGSATKGLEIIDDKDMVEINKDPECREKDFQTTAFEMV